ncbi:MAG: DUF2846 domain-containing protein [Pseudomonadota bacterium]
MRRFTALMLYGFALLLAACSATQTPVAPGAVTGAAQAGPDKAVIYIYRELGGVDTPTPTPISLDDKPLGNLVTYGYFRVVVSPGDHVISSPSWSTTPLTLHTAKGKTYYVSQELIPRQPKPIVLLNWVDENTGKRGIGRGSQIN